MAAVGRLNQARACGQAATMGPGAKAARRQIDLSSAPLCVGGRRRISHVGARPGGRASRRLSLAAKRCGRQRFGAPVADARTAPVAKFIFLQKRPHCHPSIGLVYCSAILANWARSAQLLSCWRAGPRAPVLPSQPAARHYLALFARRARRLPLPLSLCVAVMGRVHAAFWHFVRAGALGALVSF